MRGAIFTFACVLAVVPPVHAQEVTRPETGPYEITLLPAPDTPEASGHARLVFADSPFGVAVTVDGHAIYDVELTAEGLPPASDLGAYSSYVAWAVTPDLGQWVRLGTRRQRHHHGRARPARQVHDRRHGRVDGRGPHTTHVARGGGDIAR